MLLRLLTKRYFGGVPLIRKLPVGLRGWLVSRLAR